MTATAMAPESGGFSSTAATEEQQIEDTALTTELQIMATVPSICQLAKAMITTATAATIMLTLLLYWVPRGPQRVTTAYTTFPKFFNLCKKKEMWRKHRPKTETALPGFPRAASAAPGPLRVGQPGVSVGLSWAVGVTGR
jgi:hypothetical protein